MYTFYIYCERVYKPDSNYIDRSIHKFSTYIKRASIWEYFLYSRNIQHDQSYLPVECVLKNDVLASTDKLFYYPGIFTYTLYESLDECISNHFIELL